MRLLVPAVLDPGEYLAAQPELWAQLILRAVRAGSGIVHEIHVALDDSGRRPELARALGEAGATILNVRPARGDRPPFLPPGSDQGLARLSPPAPDDPVLVLNPRNPLLDGPDLATALDRARDLDSRLLLSAVPPADHPCQGRMPHTLDGPLRPLDQGARLLRDGQTSLFAPGPPPPAEAWVILVRGPGDKIMLGPRERTEAGFTLPPDFAPGPEARWGLALPAALPGPARFLLPLVPHGAPWGMDPRTNRPTAADGRRIAGRQDFPPLLAADGSLCVLRAPLILPAPGENLPHEAWELPPERSLLLHHALARVAWELAKSQAPQAGADSGAGT